MEIWEVLDQVKMSGQGEVLPFISEHYSKVINTASLSLSLFPNTPTLTRAEKFPVTPVLMIRDWMHIVKIHL